MVAAVSRSRSASLALRDSTPRAKRWSSTAAARRRNTSSRLARCAKNTAWMVSAATLRAAWCASAAGRWRSDVETAGCAQTTDLTALALDGASATLLAAAAALAARRASRRAATAEAARPAARHSDACARDPVASASRSNDAPRPLRRAANAGEPPRCSGERTGAHVEAGACVQHALRV